MTNSPTDSPAILLGTKRCWSRELMKDVTERWRKLHRYGFWSEWASIHQGLTTAKIIFQTHLWRFYQEAYGGIHQPCSWNRMMPSQRAHGRCRDADVAPWHTSLQLSLTEQQNDQIETGGKNDKGLFNCFLLQRDVVKWNYTWCSKGAPRLSLHRVDRDPTLGQKTKGGGN